MSLEIYYVYGVYVMEKDEGMKSKNIKKLAVRLVDQIRDARDKSENKPPDSQFETESIKK